MPPHKRSGHPAREGPPGVGERPWTKGRGTQAQLSWCGLQMTDYDWKRQQQNHPAEPRQPTDSGAKATAAVPATEFRVSRDRRAAGAVVNSLSFPWLDPLSRFPPTDLSAPCSPVTGELLALGRNQTPHLGAGPSRWSCRSSAWPSPRRAAAQGPRPALGRWPRPPAFKPGSPMC